MSSRIAIALVVATLALLISPSRAVWDWRQTVARLEEVGMSYEFVDVELLYQHDGDGRQSSLTLDFIAFNTSRHIVVEPDNSIFPGGAVQHRHVDKRGITKKLQHHVIDCLYRSQDPNGHVSLARTCANRFSGSFESDDGRLALVPVGKIEGSTARCLVYWIDPILDKPYHCEHKEVPEVILPSDLENPGLRTQTSRTPQQSLFSSLTGRKLTKTTKYIKLLIVNDHARFVAYGDDTLLNSAELLQETVELYNKLNEQTSTITLSLQIVGMITFSHGDYWTPEIDDDGEANEETLLSDFTSWRSQLLSTDNSLPDHGAAQLLSGLNFRSSTVGLAHVNVLCSKSSATGVVQATDSQLSTVATILAHELGHNLGVQHTTYYLEDTPVSSPCTAGSWIMDPDGVDQDDWSTCTVGWLEMAFGGVSYPSGCTSSCTYRPNYERVNSACAEDAATITWTLEPVCGNGVRESGEECDCGEDDCSDLDPCCDGSECKLIDGAECSADDVCCNESTCKIRFANESYVCRDAADEDCDIAETCNGEVSTCPVDSHMPNGNSCGTDDKGSCFVGDCKSHEEQCNNKGYVVCESADYNDYNASCGVLQCRTSESSSTCFEVDGDSGQNVEEGTTCGGLLETDEDPGDRLVCSSSACVRAATLKASATITCNNGVLDEDETDVDCGGSCNGCLPGEICISDDDCFETSSQPTYCKKNSTLAPTSAPTSASEPPVGYQCSSYDNNSAECNLYTACIYLEDYDKCKNTGVYPAGTGRCDSQSKEVSCINWSACSWNSTGENCYDNGSAATSAPTSSGPGVCASSLSSTVDDNSDSTSPFDKLLEALREHKFIAIGAGCGAFVLGLIIAIVICCRYCGSPSDAELRKRAAKGAIRRASAAGGAAGRTSQGQRSSSTSTRPGRRSTTASAAAVVAVDGSGVNQDRLPVTRPPKCPECQDNYSNKQNVRGLCNACEAERRDRSRRLELLSSTLPSELSDTPTTTSSRPSRTASNSSHSTAASSSVPITTSNARETAPSPQPTRVISIETRHLAATSLSTESTPSPSAPPLYVSPVTPATAPQVPTVTSPPAVVTPTSSLGASARRVSSPGNGVSSARSVPTVVESSVRRQSRLHEDSQSQLRSSSFAQSSPVPVDRNSEPDWDNVPTASVVPSANHVTSHVASTPAASAASAPPPMTAEAVYTPATARRGNPFIVEIDDSIL